MKVLPRRNSPANSTPMCSEDVCRYAESVLTPEFVDSIDDDVFVVLGFGGGGSRQTDMMLIDPSILIYCRLNREQLLTAAGHIGLHTAGCTNCSVCILPFQMHGCTSGPIIAKARMCKRILHVRAL